MNTSTLAKGTSAIVFAVLALTTGYRALDRDAESAVVISPNVPPAAVAKAETSGVLYGRVTTYGGATYEGRLRWGGDEEAFWGNYFNGFKDENPWAAQVRPEQLPKRHRTIEIFGFEISRGEDQVDLGRPFMMRFGDIKRIDAVGEGIDAALERGIEYAPDVRVTLKSGTVFDLDRFEAGDFDDGVRVWDLKHGVIDLGPRQIRTIEFLPTDRLVDAPDRLHGTVRTRHGDFTGFLQWDREEAAGRDELVGHAADGAEVRLRFDAIRSIARHADNGSLVTLIDGREVVLSDTRKVGRGNRGVYVDDRRYGRVLVSWNAFQRVDFSPGGSGPSYGDFPPGSPLTGSVTTRTGRRFTGRLIYDLDESETTETLDAPSRGVDYTIPFGLVASINLTGGDERVGVTLQSGETLQLECTGDLGDRNAGLLIFGDGRDYPEYVPWSDVEQVDFDRPKEMFPPVDGRYSKTH